MSSTAPQLYTITTDEVRNMSVDMSGLLDDGELLTGTPEIQCSSDLTITNAQVNTAAVMISGSLIPVGLAIQLTVEAAARARYDIELLCSTSAGQAVEGRIQLDVIRSRF